MINVRLETDCRLTSPKKSLKTKVVANTWKGALENEEDLPRNWTEVSGVLVSMRAGLREKAWVNLR
ncbi:hypothetical protein L208DRAFT_1402165 [Tricholoma matsutake]|nr:hypothetical protein L208DRAFT_1402165 [Tricholoma matsutake 945]